MTPLQLLRAERRRRWWIDPPGRVRGLRGAARFIDVVGFAFLFPQRGTDLAALLDAHSGGAVPFGWNEETGRVWDWKDELAARRLAAFGRFFRRKASFIAPRMIPAFYATGTNYGGLDDVEEAYHAGRVSPAARRLGQILAARGPLSTLRLRREAGLDGKAGASRFHRAMQELYDAFTITNVGTTDEDSRWPAAVVDLLPRVYPGEAAAGAALSVDDARARVVRGYLRQAAASTPGQAARVLGWPLADVRDAFAGLVERGEAVPWLPGRRSRGAYADPAFVAKIGTGDRGHVAAAASASRNGAGSAGD